jgi:probable O-glycosylation ligase (exosortase A-associated)
MLRTPFVLLLVAVGAYYALQGPFFALLFYLGNAYFRPETWVWGSAIQHLDLSLWIGIYLIVATIFSGQKFVWNGRLTFLGLFFLHTLLSALFSAQPLYCLSAWVESFKVMAVCYLIVVLVTDFNRLRWIVMVMVVALGLEQAKQGWFYLVTSPDFRNENRIAFFGDNNLVAVGMLMLVPLAGFLLQTTTNKRARYFYWFLLIGVLNRALSTQSRGGFLAALALGGVYVMRSPQRFRVIAGMLLALVLILPALPSTFWTRMGTIGNSEENRDSSALSRLHFWAVAVEMAKAHPIWGVGYNAYMPSYQSYDFSHGEYGEKNRAVHSSFFGVLAELGFVGAALYIGIFMSAFRTCRRVQKLGKQDQTLADLGKAALAFEISLVVFIVGGSLVSFQYNEMLYHIIGLTIVVEQLAKRQITGTTAPPLAATYGLSRSAA